MTQAQNVVPGFEISDFDLQADGSVKESTFKSSMIDDADGNPLTGFIIVGKNSQQCQAASNKVRVNNLMRQSKRNKPVDTATVEGSQIVVNNMLDNEESIALAVIVGWFGFLSEGQEMTFDYALACKLVKARPTWKAKILADLEKDANFTKV